MSETIKIEITGTLDPDQTLFTLCMATVRAVNDYKGFAQFASQVENLVEICENMGIQRMAEEVAD